ncbi:sulfur carrier protein ThiS [Candidatus Pelagibacter sp.]|uniref:sulfur carrier protein ThiS n=1 Tax=Candidatus Pelagibacter sp. TaxID=2024849 RepID=UPI003F8269FB|tara:strand:+ start:351 stop:569 length:219 start_codon:yes stop_codon:yes gene_type:complete
MKKIKKINIKLNGKKTNVDDQISLNKILKNFNIPTNKVAIELNKEIVNKKKLSSIKIRNNDSIEIVHFIGGG